MPVDISNSGCIFMEERSKLVNYNKYLPETFNEKVKCCNTNAIITGSTAGNIYQHWLFASNSALHN